MTEKLSISDARLLLLHGLGLLEDPLAASTLARTLATVRRLGFVQLDSINIVERAHHHILWSRLHGYRPKILDGLHRSRRVFEHWTHDASLIPSELFPHWRHRFTRVAWGAWIQRKLGEGHARLVDEVFDRVRREGPLLARDFEHNGRKSGAWWDWKPAKTALEYGWRTGVLSVAGRGGPGGFEKIYDLTERVLPAHHALPTPDPEVHLDWACRSALERLGAATAREIAGFWDLVLPARAAAWCASARERGEIEEVEVRSRKPSFALARWRERLAEAGERAGALSTRLRILSPFDPLIRDRARCERLFGFTFRFEAFVPHAKRVHGYYVLPVLEMSRGGARFVARVDPKLDRDAGVLTINRVWWEPGVAATRARVRALDECLERYAAFVGASRVARNWAIGEGEPRST